jgi:hypothetical protein
METTKKVDEATAKATTIISLNVEIEELEPIVAPILAKPVGNHNETLVVDEGISLNF